MVDNTGLGPVTSCTSTAKCDFLQSFSAIYGCFYSRAIAFRHFPKTRLPLFPTASVAGSVVRSIHERQRYSARAVPDVMPQVKLKFSASKSQSSRNSVAIKSQFGRNYISAIHAAMLQTISPLLFFPCNICVPPHSVHASKPGSGYGCAPAALVAAL